MKTRPSAIGTIVCEKNMVFKSWIIQCDGVIELDGIRTRCNYKEEVPVSKDGSPPVVKDWSIDMRTGKAFCPWCRQRKQEHPGE